MYLLTETASPFALERWAAFFANFGQFAKGFFYTLGISIGALIVALLLGLHVMIPISLTAILCVGVYTGAYISEIIRTGIEAVPKGQTEAALSQGFTYADTMRIIILPQAVRTILPPLTNQVVNLIKNTSTVAIISGADIMFTAKAWAYDTTNYVPAFAGAAFLYFIMCFPLATWARRKEEENKKAY